jgi:arsenate reductase (glutaredoxin)
MSKTPIAITLYHNPRCSKSRAALALLQERGIEPQIVEYLKTPPSAVELAELVAKLRIEPEALVRKGEDVFKEHYQHRKLDANEWLSVMARHPILIERPIAVRDARAVVGRPPERVLELLQKT